MSLELFNKDDFQILQSPTVEIYKDGDNWSVKLLDTSISSPQLLLELMKVLVRKQRAYLEQGLIQLKPLSQKDLAQALGLQEAKVSRILSDVVIKTPFETVRIQDLLPTSKASNRYVNCRFIKDFIIALFSNAESSDLLSDQAIAKRLTNQGIKVSRQVITKYRLQLGINSARELKRLIKQEKSKE